MKTAITIALTLLLSGCISTGIKPPYETGFFEFSGHNHSYTCAGNGSSTVFLVPPAGISAEEAFVNIFDVVATKNKICRYERLGFGESDSVSLGLNQTISDYANQLDKFIQLQANSNEIVLVGYSFGGEISRFYASQNRNRVKGLLLIDPSHEKWLQDMKQQMEASDWQAMEGILNWFLTNLGQNIWDSQFEAPESTLDVNLPIRIVSRGLSHDTIREAGVSEAGVRIYNDLHNKYQQVQESLSNNTTRVIANKSTHLILETEPDIILKELTILLENI